MMEAAPERTAPSHPCRPPGWNTPCLGDRSHRCVVGSEEAQRTWGAENTLLPIQRDVVEVLIQRNESVDLCQLWSSIKESQLELMNAQSKRGKSVPRGGLLPTLDDGTLRHEDLLKRPGSCPPGAKEDSRDRVPRPLTHLSRLKDPSQELIRIPQIRHAPVKLIDKLQSSRAVARFRAQPDNDLFGRLVNEAHQAHLLASLPQILLVDAHRI